MKKEKILTVVATATLVMGNVSNVSALPVTTDVSDKTLTKAQSDYDVKKAALEKATMEKKSAEDALAKKQTDYQTLKEEAEALYEKASSAIDGELTSCQGKMAELEMKADKMLEELDLLLKEVIDTTTTYLETLEELKEAERLLETAKEAAKEITPETIEAANEEVNASQRILDDATTTLTAADEEFQIAKEEVTTAREVFDKAKADEEAASAEKKQAEEAYQVANDKVKLAQDIVDAHEGNNSAYNQIVQDLAVAKEELRVANNEKATAEATLAESLNQKNKAKEELDVANTELDKKKATKESAQKNVEEANQLLELAKANLTQKETEYQTLESEKQTALHNLDAADTSLITAESDLTVAKNNKTEADNQVTVTQSEVAAAEINANNAQALYNKGSLGFFESVGANDAIQAMQASPYYSSTVIGDEKDATNLDNMKATLEFIKECNRLRVNDGLRPLKVSHRMMAIAQVNLNWSSTSMAHSYYGNVGENLAWGYTNPFDGWYTEEKEIYENNPQAPYEKVGHYLNIVNPGYTMTGFAVSYQSGYGSSHGQVFSYIGDGIDADTYFATFDEYYNFIINADVALEEAKAELAAALQAQETAATDVLAKEELVTAAKEAKQEAQKVVTDKDVALASKQSEVDAASAKVQANEVLVTQATNVLDIATNEMMDAQSTVLDRQNDLSAATSNYEDSFKDVTNANNLVVEKEKEVDALVATLEKFNISKEEAEANLVQAKKELENAKKALEAAEAKHSTLHNVAITSEEALNTKIRDAESKEAVYNEKLMAYEEAQNSHKNNVDERNRLTAILDQVDLAQKKVDELHSYITELKDTLLEIEKTAEQMDIDATKLLEEAESLEVYTEKVAYFRYALDEVKKGNKTPALVVENELFAQFKEMIDAYSAALLKLNTAHEEYEQAEELVKQKEENYQIALKAFNEAEKPKSTSESKNNSTNKGNKKPVTTGDLLNINGYTSTLMLSGAVAYITYKKRKQEC